MLEKLNEFINQTYARAAARVDEAVQESSQTLAQLRGLDVAIERTSRTVRALERRLDALP